MPLYRTDEFGPNASDTLSRALANQMLPTPTAADGTKMSSNPETSARRMEKGNQASLTDIIQTEMLPAAYLLPTPRAQNGEERNQNIWARPLDQPQNLENALALLPTPSANDTTGSETATARAGRGAGGPMLRDIPALLPTPTVMDMGSY